jgi:hypothetical protein
VSANNYYAGFGPETANIFRKMVGLQEVTWSKEEEDDKSDLHSSSYIQQNHDSNHTISDFMTKNSLAVTISFITYTIGYPARLLLLSSLSVLFYSW